MTIGNNETDITPIGNIRSLISLRLYYYTSDYDKIDEDKKSIVGLKNLLNIKNLSLPASVNNISEIKFLKQIENFEIHSPYIQY